MKNYFVLLTVLMFCLENYAQTPTIPDPYLKFRHLTNDDGLSDNYILDILQDKEGFIWIATKYGLNRYDGYTIENYTTANTADLKSNHINSLELATDSSIWIGTTKGLCRYFPKTRDFISVNPKHDSTLASAHVRAFFQDKGKVLWVETNRGKLIRYNWASGEVKIIAHNPPSMTDTYFYHDIAPGENNNLWLGGRYMGIMRFDTTTKEFHIIPNFFNQKGKKRDSDVAVYYCDSNNQNWIGGIDGFYSFDPDLEYFQNHLQISTFDIAETSDKKLWIGTGSGIYILSPDRQSFFFQMHNDNNRFSIIDNHINKVFIDNSDNVWLGTTDGISIYSPSANKFKHIYHIAENPLTPSANHVSAIMEDSKKRIWVGTAQGGLDCFDSRWQRLYHYGADQPEPFQLSSNRISTLMEDQDGDIWVGQWAGKGLNVVNPDRKTNRHFWFLPNELRADWYNDILQDSQGNIWLGLWGAQGLYQFDKSNWKVKDQHFAFVPEYLDYLLDLRSDGKYIHLAGKHFGYPIYFDTENEKFNYHLDKNYYSYNFGGSYSFENTNGNLIINSANGKFLIKSNPEFSCRQLTREKNTIPEFGSPLKEIDNGTTVYREIKVKSGIWMATSKGIAHESRGGKLNYFLIDYDTIRSLTFGTNGILWAITKKSLIRFDTLSKKATIIDGSEQKYIASRLVSCMYEDSKGNLWIGNTEGSLNCMNLATGKIENYNGKSVIPDGFKAKEVTFVTEGPKGNIWIGGDGLFKFDSSHRFSHIGKVDGLPSNKVQALLFDNSKNLWTSSNRGLSCYNPIDQSIINYSREDGLQDNEFSRAATKLSDGTMVFGGKSGLTVFHPASLPINQQPPNVEITGFYLFEQKQEINFVNTKKIELKYNQNYFSFDFTALDFSNPSKNTYQYKLENFDNEWISTSALNRKARYTNVNPGNYIFRVRAANNDGIFKKEGTFIKLVISPPFWQTWWFTLFVIIAIIALIVIWVKQREKKITEQNRVLTLEQKLLRSQMNPHFIFNSLSSIQSFIFESNPVVAGTYLSRFAELIRSILYNSREELIPISKEISMLRNYLDLQQLRYQNKFDYELITDNLDEDLSIMIPPMIAQPFIENSIEHGIKNLDYKGLIKVVFNQNNNFLELIVEDNGIGIEASRKLKNEKAKKHVSLAITITRERIEILNKGKKNKPNQMKIEDIGKTDETHSGTRVTFRLATDN